MNIRNITICTLMALSCFQSYGMKRQADQLLSGQKTTFDAADIGPQPKKLCLEQNSKSPLHIECEKITFSLDSIALENLLTTPQAAQLNKAERAELYAQAKQLKRQIREMRTIGNTITTQVNSPALKAKFLFDDEYKNIQKITHYLYALNTLPKFTFPQAFFTSVPYSNNPSYKPTPDEALLALIKNEQQKISICCFHFNLMNIALALIHQKKKGIIIELFTNQDQGTGQDSQHVIKLLMDNKISVCSPQNDRYESNHHKFAIFACNLLDKKILCTGSFNWTDNAKHRSWDDLNVLDNEEIIEQYTGRIAQLTERSSKYIISAAPTFQQSRPHSTQQPKRFQ